MCQEGLISIPDLNYHNYLLQMKGNRKYCSFFIKDVKYQVSNWQGCNTASGASFHWQTETLNSLMF